MKRTVRALVVGLLLPFVAFSLTPHPLVAAGGKKKKKKAAAAATVETPPTIPPTLPPRTSAEIEAALDAKLAAIVPVSVRQIPLEDVLKWIAKTTKADVLVDHKNIEDEGIDLSGPVTLELQTPTTAATLLDIVLEPYQLGYCYHHGVVYVTTAARLGKILETRVYDVRELYQVVPAKSSKASEGGNEHPGAPSATEVPGADAEGAIDSLIEVLTATIEPDSWDEVGGAGSIQQFETVLVIRQTQAVHRQIRQLFGDLRKRQMTAETEAALDVKLGTAMSVDFAETPLEDVLRAISIKTGADVVIDRATAVKGGLDLSSPVTLHLQDPASAARLLNLVLAPLQLGYCYRHNAVFVTTMTRLMSILETRVYEVRDLYPSIVPADPMRGGSSGGAQGFGPTGQGFGPMGKVPVSHANRERTSLELLVEQTIDPRTWDNVGGAGVVTECLDTLVIRQTQATHRQIRQMLDDLRKARASRPKDAVSP